MIHSESLPFGEPAYGGRWTSGFGPRGRSMHNGLDIAASRGTPIYSTADGVVTFAGRQRGYGILVKIRHAFGFETVYAHLMPRTREDGAARRAWRSYRGYGKHGPQHWQPCPLRDPDRQ